MKTIHDLTERQLNRIAKAMKADGFKDEAEMILLGNLWDEPVVQDYVDALIEGDL